MCQQDGEDIAEFAAGNADHRRVVFIGPLLQGKEIVELLRQPAGDIDRVGGGEEDFFIEGGISKRFFYDALAIIEAAVYFQGRDILTEGRQLQFLHAAHFSGRVENDDVDPFHVIESTGYGAACVSGGGDRKSTRLNSSHQIISYAVFCLKKKKQNIPKCHCVSNYSCLLS